MSNRTIKREIAIQRIKHITSLIKTKQYSQLETVTYELLPPTEAIVPLDSTIPLDKLPSRLIESTINQPFYRFHNQDQYILGD